jgi:arabinogalactan oligomer/maltooligosaccharide transport system permease protein
MSPIEKTNLSKEPASQPSRPAHRISEHKANLVKKNVAVVLHNVLIGLMAVLWLFPVLWLVLCSFSTATSPSVTTFFPKAYTLTNYLSIFNPNGDTANQFPTWFRNTLVVSSLTCLISTVFVLQVSFALSRMRFRGRKSLMNVSMILGLFPGLLSMICIYFLFQYVFRINDFLMRLVIAYSAASGLGYLIAKGFFDTIPKDIDEAAKIDGASEFQIFTRITIPLSKPIIVYTILTSFMGPWVDFVFAYIILPSGKTQYYTVAIGLYNMLNRSLLSTHYGIFCAGAVIISIPLSVLFMFVQKYYVAGITGGAVKG